MKRWMRKIHKWLGLVLAVQFLLWMASGLAMSLFDADKVRGREFRIKPAQGAEWPATAVPLDTVLAGSRDYVASASTAWVLETPVYRLANDKSAWMVRAADGKPFALDAALARKIAQASYSGDGSPAATRQLNYSPEAREHKGPVWRVDFSDAAETAVYVSSRTGAVVEHRNSTWRMFDFFWMLHIMDYAERSNFNNPLVVSSSVAGLWVALTGVWLLFTSFRVRDFVPRRWRKAA